MNKISATINRYKGVDIDPDKLPDDTAVFQAQLQQAIPEWQAGGLRVVWLKLPIVKASLIPVATAVGFRFHHRSESHHDSQYVMLTYALQPNAFVPPHATHYIGAGGVVLNEKRELLVITERNHVENGHLRYYKLPGGALDQGEDLTTAVQREVLEETGINTTFDALVCFRHWHKYRFGKADILIRCPPQLELVITSHYSILDQTNTSCHLLVNV